MFKTIRSTRFLDRFGVSVMSINNILRSSKLVLWICFNIFGHNCLVWTFIEFVVALSVQKLANAWFIWRRAFYPSSFVLYDQQHFPYQYYFIETFYGIWKNNLGFWLLLRVISFELIIYLGSVLLWCTLYNFDITTIWAIHMYGCILHFCN